MAGPANAIVGSLMMVAVALVVAHPSACWPAPTSPSSGATAGSRTRFGSSTTSCCSAPSIIIGCSSTTYRAAQRALLGWAGALALAHHRGARRGADHGRHAAARAHHLREAAPRLGCTTMAGGDGISPTGRPDRAIVTGILLAVARISGETAPLLFTALNHQFLGPHEHSARQPAGRDLPVRHESLCGLAAFGVGGRPLITLAVLGSTSGRAGSSDRQAVNELKPAQWTGPSCAEVGPIGGRSSTAGQEGGSSQPRADGQPRSWFGTSVLLRQAPGRSRHQPDIGPTASPRSSALRVAASRPLLRASIASTTSTPSSMPTARSSSTARTCSIRAPISTCCARRSAWCSSGRHPFRCRSTTTSRSACGSDERLSAAEHGRARRVGAAQGGLWDEVKDKLRSDRHGLSGGQQQRLCIARPSP